MLPAKYMKPIQILGTAAVLVLLFGLVIFPPLSESAFSEETQDSVLVSAIPFVAVFVTIILMFALLITLAALRFNGSIPYRTHHPIELLIIFGILCGVFFLFQPWELVSFRYGFLWLLGSTLGFTLWSHIVPRASRIEQEAPEYATWYGGGVIVLAILAALVFGVSYGAYLLVTGILVYILWSQGRPAAYATEPHLPAFQLQHYLIAGVLGLVLTAVIVGVVLSASNPEEPYGYSQRMWDRGLREEQKAQIIQEAEDTYQQFTIPFAVFMSLIPGSILFFLAREIAASDMPETAAIVQPHSASPG
jgi:hypothetical protein